VKHRPIAIDLFAGCGGMSLGLEAAGFDIAVAFIILTFPIVKLFAGI